MRSISPEKQWSRRRLRASRGVVFRRTKRGKFREDASQIPSNWWRCTPHRDADGVHTVSQFYHQSHFMLVTLVKALFDARNAGLLNVGVRADSSQDYGYSADYPS